MQSDRIVTFANIHESEDYKQDMLNDLEREGYSPQQVLDKIRGKGGAFRWKLKYKIRKDDGETLPGLRIKDLRTNNYIDLSKYHKPLIDYPEFRNSEGYLIAEDEGWELNLPFKDKLELLKLTSLFLEKSGEYIYDLDGNEIEESEEEKEKENHGETRMILPY